MKRATITETKNQLSALLDRVRQGETVLILDRGRPVGQLAPVVGSKADDPEGRLARLERQAAIRRALAPLPPGLLEGRPPLPRRGASALRALLAERREGR